MIQTGTVLVVDHKEDRLSLAKTLEKMGLKVLGAEKLQDCLDLVRILVT